ncbi:MULTISPECIES: contact-dependent growth inhibition system immunity protein [Pseudescherichia]|uniref:contact-dependent growth inhibition system immunity protein n=1 Tax=Pseudescherichia TaxID=2055880 RepID=UPI001EDE2767|nr:MULTISPECIES: contact-dependent growth inhibition system immunity protein [Pseudescherichia]
MDTNIEKTCELDNLVTVYFGQDCDIFDENCDFDNLLNEYLSTSSAFSLRVLLANLIELNTQDDRCEVLLARYNGEFAPERWEMSAQDWLDIVTQRLIDFMNEKGFSTVLSQF